MLMLANRAADIGPSRFDWWPNWRGESVAIVASGPSAKGAGVAALRGRMRVMAIKQSVDLCPFADALYGCDSPWWRHRRGLPEFRGLKLCWRGNGLMAMPEIQRIDIEKTTDRILLDEPGRIGAGGNSGFQAVNLAVQFGASRLLLVGFDMSDRSGAHWYGRNNWPMANNPDEGNFQRWRKAIAIAVEQLSQMGVEVINASPISKIPGAHRRSIDETLKEWA